MLCFPRVVVLASFKRTLNGSARKVVPDVPEQYHPRPMTRTTRSLSLLAFAVVLIGLLLVLAPNLQRIELRPGEQDLSFLGEVETGVVDLGTGSAGAGGTAIVLRIFMIAALVCSAGILIAAIFKRRLRLYVIGFLVICGIVWGIWYALISMATRDGSPVEEESGASGQMPDLPEDQPAWSAQGEIATPPPGWAFPAVAIGISIGVALIVAVVLARLAPRWKGRRRHSDKTELEELVDTVGAAADEILLGGDPRLAVLRCYREMIRILCKKRSIDHVHMTARELADALERAGFTAVHIDRLTGIFELVRYGNRSENTLAERAIGCLEAIREAYAT